MRKKLLCLFLVICALVCLQSAVFAEDLQYIDQIVAPIGGGYTDLEGNFVLDAPGEFVPLTAEFVGKDGAQVEWSVFDGKDVVEISKRDGYTNQAILTALSDGEATIVAYLEDDSQSVISAKVFVSNQTKSTASIATLHVSVEGIGDVFRKKESGDSIVLGSSYTNQHSIGMEVDLTAVESTMPFKYWVVRRGADQDVIVSTELNYKFILSGDITVAAVFDQTGIYKGTNATFVCNNLVASNIYVKSLSQNEPTPLYQRNMEFVKWISAQVDADAVLENKKVDKDEITQATTFIATYQKKPSAYTITVVGGSGSGTYAYGDAVVAQVTDTAQDGKQFLFWSKDGAPVSYDATYAFSAMQDCTVTAVFGAAVQTDGINMVMQTPLEDGNVIAFTLERYVPENYNFISSGFVVGNSKICKLGDMDAFGNSANYMEAVSYRGGERTQFTKSLKKISGVTTYYARGYVIYKDGDTVKTIYTPAQKIVIE